MKTIHKDYWGRYKSSSQGAEARVYAKSVELRYMDSGMTTRYTVTEFKKKSEIRWEAMLEAFNLPSRQIAFTQYRPYGQEEEQTAIEWPDVRVGKLVIVEKYTDDDNTTLVILVLAAILLFVILFNK